MSEEKNNLANSKYVIAGVSAFIFNDKDELLLTKQPQWGGKWLVPGGKVEYGENMETALKREVKEEVNLEIKNLKFFQYVELKNTQERPNLHMVVNQFIAYLENGEVILDEESSDYSWRSPKDWLKEKDLYPSVRQAIEYYINEFLVINNLEHKYKRALADYQNLLKQTAKDKLEFAQFANEQMLLEILPVYDHLKLALAHANNTPNDAKTIVEGVGHVVKQFKNTLKEVGVEEIQTAGKNFDHNFMEAVSEQETDEEAQDGLVAKEVSAGYKLNGKVIIPAKVVVYKMKS